ncbi:23S rRNA (adenine-N6)-dimethyltransferase [Nocardiopsis mwathae]|uniref:23S rRNA (Adenine-N6)-dimethyltransferase n=1 Tax=Nocardiopsis mwathae TaxID=1472723 RepID=A0A7X0D4W4_9ACTN|nr:23S ribosomal RNA methyltransferase Erm [Nocardiopsis mwathae]MBB6171737.1 23S rRNA (adenine-N6)-dimethyltransferase [Nocardiopsis mwathae]
MPANATHHGGRHELGQNFLADRTVIATFTDLVARTTGPIVEIGAGDGALTLPISRSGRPLTAVEIDPRRARRLQRRASANVTVVNDDILRFRLPRHPHAVVGNVPFHLTTALLRRLLAADNWQHAVLLVQWEVARRRAGVGGASMLTAAWWPWYSFDLHSRVPARAFRPMPAVDGGLLTITRRDRALVADRRAYQDFVRQVFTGRGRGLRDILLHTGRLDARTLDRWLREHSLPARALPKSLTADQWAALWQLTARPGPSAPQRRRGPERSGRRHRRSA